MDKHVEIIKDSTEILAIILRASYSKEGLSFLTPENFPLQMGVHIHEKGHSVKPHSHNHIYELKDITAQEIFYVAKGQIKVILYNNSDIKVSEKIICEGDTILLSGGHGVEFLKDSKVIEFKQGPYVGAKKEKHYIN